MDSRRLAYLKALDIDVWERRDPSARASAAQPSAQPSAQADAQPAVRVEAAPAPMAPVIPIRTEPAVQARVVQSPGIDTKVDLADADASVANLGWDELATAVRSCTKCPLHATRTNGVFGVGDRRARWMIIGEAPGADEDKQGEPFVGRAGMLLNAMLKAVGLGREQVFIANILKSRPPNNRDPKPEEVRACIPYLYRQIELVNPALILCVGRIAAQTLLEVDTPIGKLRGAVHRIAGNRPMVVTYHPAYLLRSPVEKRKSWADLLLAMRTFETLQSGATA
ncbi:uracil-DNA glycosylase [Steroidobacter sp. S1-65]|uniref:Type-4 uracil-DNA glycosylase n=1 Tax=Steroidobacter gossypii TaxID=2805490 RepID=A0ABS1X691_9GAMM|nr:uracil-DNA glycosylase [Steroidobacter gossypii]MBM0108728.1 uracil-DNA glycosylase [Steroidobacter gossypii]